MGKQVKLVNTMDRPRVFSVKEGKESIRIKSSGYVELAEELLTKEINDNIKKGLLVKLPLEEIKPKVKTTVKTDDSKE